MDDPPSAKPHAHAAIQHVSFLGAARPAAASLARAWKTARPGLTVTGLDAPDALEAAEASGAIDRKAASLDTAARDTDLVVLAGRLPAACRPRCATWKSWPRTWRPARSSPTSAR